VSERLAVMAQRAWTGARPADRALRAALMPASLAYGAATAVRNRLYDAGWLRARRVPAHVVSVGNISVGGTGKTPATLWLAQELAARGRHTGIVTRGYRKRQRGIVVVGIDGRPFVGPEEGGDEPVMLARRFAGPVIAGEERAAAAAYACAQFALDTIVLDDGFQHRGLARDADLVLVRAGELDAARLLPAGPLRESARGLARARAFLVVDDAAVPAAAQPVYRGRMRATALVRAVGDRWVEEPLAVLEGRTVVAVAGIARPDRFFASLERLGARVRTTMTFPDHHRYGADEIGRIGKELTERLVVTTEKDLVKLAPVPGLEPVRALRMSLEVDDGPALVDLLTRPVDLRAF